MKNFFIFIFIFMMLFFAGPLTAKTAKEIFVSGIRNQEYQYRFDPKPASSEYLRTKMGGFNVSEYGARYYCMWDIVKARPQTIYAKVELYNPANRGIIIEEGVITPENEVLYIATPPVADLKMLDIYQIKVFLYKDKNKSVMIDHLEQDIKAHVDTREGLIIIDKVLVTTAGEDMNSALHKLGN